MVETEKKEYHEEDATTESVDNLVEHRVRWLFLGLLGGLVTAYIVSNYEAILASDIRLAFFIPLIVYLSDAVGTQTETIYVRALAHKKRLNFLKYTLKESAVGMALGIIFGGILGGVAAYWLNSQAIGVTIGLAVFINLSIAPAVALFISNTIHKRHHDPALGTWPVGTIIQDLISILVYFIMASIIIF